MAVSVIIESPSMRTTAFPCIATIDVDAAPAGDRGRRRHRGPACAGDNRCRSSCTGTAPELGSTGERRGDSRRDRRGPDRLGCPCVAGLLGLTLAQSMRLQIPFMMEADEVGSSMEALGLAI